MRILKWKLQRQSMWCPHFDIVVQTELVWVMRYKKCRPGEGSNTLDAEFGGCAMPIESLTFWLQKRGKSSCGVSKSISKSFSSIVYLVFSFSKPQPSSCTQCNFRWIYRAWIADCDQAPHVLLRGCPAAPAGLGSACHGEGTFVGTEG